MHIPREFIDQVLAQTNIVDIIDSFISLKKFGANYKACCPFHDEKSPSFVVSPQKQIYHCFGCSAGGNVISFLMEYEHVNFVEAIKTLAARAHLTIPDHVAQETPSAKTQTNLYDLMQSACEFYQTQLKSASAERAKSYLIQRGLSGAIAKQFELGYAPNAWDTLLHHLRCQKFSIDDMEIAGLLSQKKYDKFRDRVMFPIHDRQGRVIAFGGRIIDQGEPKYLNSPETPIFHKSNELYGLSQWLKIQRQHDSVIVVEGYMDVLALVQQGVINVVGTLGTATTEQHLQLLYRYTDKIIFCFDGDDAGRKAAWRALTVALPKLKSNKTLRFAFLPQGEDPDTFIRQQGKPAFENFLQQASTLSEFFIQHLIVGLNLSIADHRAQLLHQANQLLQTMSDVELQRILCQELSHYVRIPANDILNLLKKPQQQETRTLLRMTQNTMPTNLRKAMAIIVQYPQHALSIMPHVDSLGTQHDFLKQLLLFIQANPAVTTAHLLEHHRESAYLKALTALSTQTLLIPEAGLEIELRDAIQKVMTEEKTQQMEALIAKAQKLPLSDEEKQMLQQWLKQRHDL